MDYHHETFPRAPIVEAVVDIRMPKIDIAPSAFETFFRTIAPEYPDRHPRPITERDILMIETGPQISEPKLVANGFLYRSQEQTRVVQARENGFSYSKLAPYQDWPTLRNEAKRLWGIYASTFRPTKIDRVALRYINRILLPLPITSFQDYIITGFDVAPGVPQAVAELFLRAVLVHPGAIGRTFAILTSTMELPTDNKLPYIFDIDTFSNLDLHETNESIWSELEMLRDFKNQIFFNSLTERARDLFR